jgi:hypothetical protein
MSDEPTIMSLPFEDIQGYNRVVALSYERMHMSRLDCWIYFNQTTKTILLKFYTGYEYFDGLDDDDVNIATEYALNCVQQKYNIPRCELSVTQ